MDDGPLVPFATSSQQVHEDIIWINACSACFKAQLPRCTFLVKPFPSSLIFHDLLYYKEVGEKHSLDLDAIMMGISEANAASVVPHDLHRTMQLILQTDRIEEELTRSRSSYRLSMLPLREFSFGRAFNRATAKMADRMPHH